MSNPLAGANEILQKGLGRFGKLNPARKNHLALAIVILVLGAGMFFSVFFGEKAWAREKFGWGNQEKIISRIYKVKISAEIIDPLNRVGKGAFGEVCTAECREERKIQETKRDKNEMEKLVSGRPIEIMIPHIAKRNRKVAAYLVAIAKKESDWGRHTPKKNGQECWNFWGYRGAENPTDSGYSCFDSPEHAVEIVGNRIEKLINQQIDTPTRMVVWKCGRDCEATGGQAAANKWISDVAHIYKKLES